MIPSLGKYKVLDQQGSSLFFQVISRRHQRKSTFPTTIPHLEALQEACQLFEKEREPWKQERLERGSP